jgi:Bacterial protein of unknown function (DUF839)
MRERKKRLTAVLLVLVAAAATTVAAFAATQTGPSSSHAPYVLPARADVDVVSILTVGDNVPGTDADGPGYQMVGIPDGLGAYRGRGSGRTFTLVMNHELGQTAGAVRDHGATGAFVSKWTIDRKTLRVLSGEDLIDQVVLAPGGVYGAPQKGVMLGRLCSGDLAERSAFYDKRSRRGYAGPLFLSGEEIGAEGRGFAHTFDGTSYELPFLGKMSWENILANPGTRDETVVVGMDDSTPGQVYVYVGEKRRFGTPVERAGLVGGKLYGVRVVGFPTEPAAGIPSGTPFELVEIPNAQAKTGAVIDSESRANGVTDFNRPEDGSWNPDDRDEFYWVTTDRARAAGGASRLWRFNFQNLGNLGSGQVAGTIDMLLDGTEGQEMLDNMTVDRYGRVLINEDPGNNPLASRIWSYDIDSDSLTQLTSQEQAHAPQPNPAYTTYTTNDEETSGIIPADDILGKGWYLVDSQIHESVFPNAADRTKLVEKGQLSALYYPVKGKGKDDDNDDDDD